MQKYVKIYEGKPDDEEFLPFSTIKIPQYSNKPPSNKFKNFLVNNVESFECRLTCNTAMNAILTNDTILKINTERCISCLACLCSNRNPFRLLHQEITEVLTSIIPNLSEFKSSYNNSLFNGSLKLIPKNESLSLEINSFDQYTADKEVEHIALWTTIMLQFLASDDNARIGKEIHITNPISPRDNRLDTCCISNQRILVGETKNTLDSLLQENRYRTQIPSYQSIIEKQVQEHNDLYAQHKDAMVILIIGGRETDMLPFGDPLCTSLVGSRSQRFYKDIIDYDIKFISAHLIWTMALYSLLIKKRLCWDLFLPQVFQNEDVLGILSGGQVIKQGAQIKLEGIDSKILDSSVQDFS
jgi:hypothetical protein